MAEFLKNARNNYKKLIVALAAVLAIYLLFTGVRVIVVILAMIVIGAGSTFYQIFFRSPINF